MIIEQYGKTFQDTYVKRDGKWLLDSMHNWNGK